MKRRPLLTILVVGILVLAGVFWWYLQSLNSPLEVLNVLNPRNAGNTNISPSLPTELVSTTVRVPDEWSSASALQVPRTLEVPQGFVISVFAAGFAKPRFFALHPDGTLFLSDSDAGTVLALPDADRNGSADRIITVAGGMKTPHGMVFDGTDLYVAEQSRVTRLRDTNNDYVADERTLLVDNLPSGGGHVTRTIVLGPDERLYVSVGSSCNVCKDDPRRAAILSFAKDGSDEQLFASGLRNAVGLTFRPGTEELWATDNQRDLLGDDIPPDEVNLVVDGGGYGWPYCYGDRIIDTSQGEGVTCAASVSPRVAVQAHSAPLGLRFYDGTAFPDAFHGKLFVAFHGSWNRREPTGYKVVVSDVGAAEATVTDFVRGWLVNGKSWGRPVDVLVAPDGSMYLSDDGAGLVYRVTYAPS